MYTLVCSLPNFYLFSFQGVERLKTGQSASQEEIKRLQAGRMKTKLRIAFKNLVYLKSLRLEMAVSKLEKMQSSSKLRGLKSLCWLKVLFYFSRPKYLCSSAKKVTFGSDC